MDGSGSTGPRAASADHRGSRWRAARQGGGTGTSSGPGRVRRWLARAVARIADTAIRLLGEGPAAGREEISGADLRDLVAANTLLKVEERQLIEDVLSAGRRPIREVMVPRTEVLFLAANLTVSRALRQVRNVEHSRYPVVEETNDDVIGFVRMRDLLVHRDGDRTTTVGRLAREIKHLPTTKPLMAALSELRGEGYPMAVVVDEYGGTAGIVTMEDLIEELVGEIRDELVVVDPGTGTPPEMPGLTNVTDLAARTGLRLPDGPYETLGGYVMACLGKVPAVGDQVDVDGWRLSVLALEGRRVSRVALTQHPEHLPATGDGQRGDRQLGDGQREPSGEPRPAVPGARDARAAGAPQQVVARRAAGPSSQRAPEPRRATARPLGS